MMTVLLVCAVLAVLFTSVCIVRSGKFDREDRMSFKEAMNLTSLPIITFYQDEEKFNFLLDTGSNNSHISRSASERLKGEIIEVGELSTSGLGGSVNSNKVIRTLLTYNDKSYLDELIIGEHLDNVFSELKTETGVTVHGIIGSRFLDRNDYILDFQEYVAYSKK